jgi:hypothetical protein
VDHSETLTVNEGKSKCYYYLIQNIDLNYQCTYYFLGVLVHNPKIFLMVSFNENGNMNTTFLTTLTQVLGTEAIFQDVVWYHIYHDDVVVENTN